MERVFIGFDSLTRTTLKGSYIMNASGSGDESPEETYGPPKDVTTNESPSSKSQSLESSYKCQHCEIAFCDCIMYIMHMAYHGCQAYNFPIEMPLVFSWDYDEGL